MAGTIAAGGISSRATSRVRFELATESDDADIRRLLRENPMAGRISITLEREPCYFADNNLPGNERQTIIVRENGRVVCMGGCAIRQRYVNGQPCRVGYLGSLRLDASVAGRFDIVRRGYEFFRELQASAPAEFYFTSIADDNVRARQFLERGLPGMPAYEFIGEFETLLVPTTRGRRREESDGPDNFKAPSLHVGGYESIEELTASLNEYNRFFQFAPHWTVDELTALQALGLRMDDFFVLSDGPRISGCAAVWDQRAFKQTVIRGYAPWLAMMRPLVDRISRITGNPRLPVAGETLANAFVSHLAVQSDKSCLLPEMIGHLRRIAAERGIELLTLGFADHDPRLGSVRNHFRCREYRSRLYVVRWHDMGGAASDLDGLCLAPEVALL